MKGRRAYMKKIGMCISSCDAYSDIWPIFFHFMKKYWSGISYPIYLNTETKNYFDDIFNVIALHELTPHSTWSSRLIQALNRIEEEYVLLILDDFFILSEVQEEEIDKCVVALEQNKNIACFHFCNMNPTEGTRIPVEFEKFKKRDPKWWYWVNFLPALWRKSALIKLLSPYENAWQAEFFGTIRAKLSKYNFYTLSDNEKPIINYNILLQEGYGLCQGKWTVSTKELFEKEGLEVDMEKRGFCNPDNISTTVQFPKMLLRHRINYFIYGGIDEADVESTKGYYRIPIRIQISLMFCHPRTFMKIFRKKINYLFGRYQGKTVDTASGRFLDY